MVAVRDQLLCFAVRLVDQTHVDAVERLFADQKIRDRLQKLFAQTPVHFASFALLPLTAARASTQSETGLLLELTLNPGCSGEAAIDALLTRDLALLWSVYGRCLADEATEPLKALRELLLDNMSRAEGGYVGYRDRTVAQIHDEQRLFRVARSEVAQVLGSTPTADSRSLADVALGLTSRPEFSFAQQPSHRSFWRKRHRQSWRKAALLAAVLVVPGLLVAATLLGAFAVPGIAAIAAGSTLLDARTVFGPIVFGRFSEYSVHAVASVVVGLIIIEALVGLLRINRLSITASLMVVIGLSVAAVAVPLVGRPHWSSLFSFFGSIAVLALWGLGVLSFVLTVALGIAILFFVALMVVPAYLGLRVLVPVFVLLLTATLSAAHVWINALIAAPPAWLRDFAPLLALQRATPPPGLTPIDAVLLLLCVFTIVGLMIVRLWWRIIPRLAPWIGWADRPNLYDVPRAQQCDPRVAAGERELTPRPNHMISVTDIRGRLPLCRWALRAFLRIIMFFGATWYTEGRLGTAAGIKFAHWHVLDKGRRLVFFSNFDGGFGGYLDEFIGGVSQGINLIWRWTELREGPISAAGEPAKKCAGRRFPTTWALAFGGCRHEQWFKAYARDSMIPHLYRFEAYRFTNLDIERATRLRDSLSGTRNEASDDRVMRALES